MKSTEYEPQMHSSGRSPAAPDEAVGRFKSTKRLAAADQRVAAVNMGKLAALLNPQNPLDGAHRIAKESKNAGILEKRKRFFRLPGQGNRVWDLR
jgi:hypothetical protein